MSREGCNVATYAPITARDSAAAAVTRRDATRRHAATHNVDSIKTPKMDELFYDEAL